MEISGRITLNLDCEEIKIAQSITKFSSENLRTLKPEEVNSCFDLLGKDKLTIEQAQVLWHLILQVERKFVIFLKVCMCLVRFFVCFSSRFLYLKFFTVYCNREQSGFDS